jgi:hypothetical protein
MAEHDNPLPEPRLPEDEERLKRQAVDRPVPKPGYVGTPPEEAPGPGKPVVFPPKEPS